MKTIKNFLLIFSSACSLQADTLVELTDKAKNNDALGAQILESQRSDDAKGLIPKFTYYHPAYFWI